MKQGFQVVILGLDPRIQKNKKIPAFAGMTYQSLLIEVLDHR